MPQKIKFKSPLLPIFLIVVVDVLGLTIILPLLPFYAEKMGATPSIVGLLVTTYAACQLVAGPILGRLSDRLGRRPLLLVSQLGTLAGFLILAFAQSLWIVFLSRIIDGLTAGNLSLAQAYISDVTEPKDRAKAFGLIGVAFGMGFLFGPAISGYLSQFSYQYPIFAAAGLSFTSILGTYFLLSSSSPVLEENRPSPSSVESATGRRLSLLEWGNYRQYFRRQNLVQLLCEFALFCFGFAMFTSGFALFAERRYVYQGLPFGPKQVGYVFAYIGLLGVILQGGMIKRLVGQFGEQPLVRIGFLAAGLGFGILGFTYRLPELLLASAVATFGTGVLRPTLTSLITQSVERNEQGVILGLTQSLFSLAQIIGPMVSGFLIDQRWLTLWALAIASCSGLGFLVTRRRDFRPDFQNRTPSPA